VRKRGQVKVNKDLAQIEALLCERSIEAPANVRLIERGLPSPLKLLLEASAPFDFGVVDKVVDLRLLRRFAPIAVNFCVVVIDELLDALSCSLDRNMAVNI